MRSNVLNNIYLFLRECFEYFIEWKIRKSSMTSMGFLIIVLTIGFIGYNSISITKGDFIFTVGDNTPSDYIITVIFSVLGFSLIVLEYLSDSKRNGYLHNIVDSGFNTQKLENKFLPRKQRKGNVIPFRRKIDTYNKKEVIDMYLESKNTLKERVDNDDVEYTIVSGLGSFPHLYLVGTQFGTGYAEDVEVLDYNRDKTKWYANKFVGKKLDYQINFDNITVEEKLEQLKRNEYDEVGIAISNTYTIEKESIPTTLKDNILFLVLPNLGINSCDSKRTQIHLINQINVLINELSNTKNKIHLFVSARASFCIRMGIYYTPKSSAKLVLHNYSMQKRDWFISLHDNKIINE